ncbi:SAM-dependent methyltransferase [Amycolatopsis sp. NPDC059021]|uniref:SAM-dependent methyltransferase n=1 Tax=Amycolatopsis sp. NPDC059021 TaxID=3346704 RepID=UPI00366C22FB
MIDTLLRDTATAEASAATAPVPPDVGETGRVLYLQREHDHRHSLLPSPFRVAQALLGDPHPYESEQHVLNQLWDVVPVPGELALAPYRCHGRVVRYLAAQAGHRRFVLADLTVPPPSLTPLHAEVHRYTGDATTVYVGSDPMALTHARALLAEPCVAVEDGNVLDPDTAMTAAAEHLDLSLPVVVQLGTAISHCNDRTATAMLTRYAHLLAPGSVVIVSAYTAPAAGPRARIARAVADIHHRHGLGPIRFRPIAALDNLLPGNMIPLPSGPGRAPGGFVSCDRWWPTGPRIDSGPVSPAAGMVATVAVTIP